MRIEDIIEKTFATMEEIGIVIRNPIFEDSKKEKIIGLQIDAPSLFLKKLAMERIGEYLKPFENYYIQDIEGCHYFFIFNNAQKNQNG